MLAVTERLVRLTAEGEARGEACSAIREAINNEVRQGTDPVNEPEEYGRRVAAASRRWKGANPSAVRENRLVKEARELVAKADEGDDDVLMETGGAGVAKCPLMGDSNFSAHGGALVNSECGHVYSKDGILSHFNVGLGGRGAKTFEQIDPTISRPCPQAGCSHQVRKVGLSKDFRAENSQRRAARRAATQTSGEDGEDLDDDDDGVEEL